MKASARIFLLCVNFILEIYLTFALIDVLETYALYQNVLVNHVLENVLD